MQFTRLAIVRQWATVAIFVALALAGLVAYRGLPINQFPNVNIPVVTITTTYPGANPQEIETQISRPIEDAVAGLNNIDQISSLSGQGFSAVTVVFTDAADSRQISADVQQRVGTVVTDFPTGANQPSVLKVDLSQVPVMQLALIDDSLPPQELYRLAHDEVRPGLEQIHGVSQVELIGGRQEEVHVAVDPGRLAGYGVTLAQVQAALGAANTSFPGGSITDGPRQFDIEVNGLVARPEDLGNVVVAAVDGQAVHVSDLAAVTQGATEQTQITRVNGRQAILIALGQQSGTNLTDVTDAVTTGLPAMARQLPSSSRLVVVQDTAPYVRASLTGIQQELIGAVLLTSLILLAFLHNPRAAGIVLLSIPTTLLTTFVAMQLMGFSLNFLSMLGLTLTIGILVDDSIVVLENILRHRARGEPPFEAALAGRAEIGLAAVAITLVDVVVFAPTGLVRGQIGGFFREFGFTIAAATLTSLLVSFTLTPLLAARFLKADDGEADRGRIARFGRWWDRGFARLEARYRTILTWSLGHRLAVCAAAAATVVAGLALVVTGRVAVEFIPASDAGYFTVGTETPPGTSLAVHDAAMASVERILLQMPEVENVTASVGVSASGIFGSGSTGQARLGTVTVQVKPLSSGRRDIFAIVEDARARLRAVPGVTVKVAVVGGQPGGNATQPIYVRVTGPELGTLNDIATQLEQALQQTRGLINVTNGAPVGQPQLLVRIDQARAADLGVSSTAVGTLVRTAFSGVIATKYQKADGTLEDVRLQLSSDARADIARVSTLPVQTAAGQTVQLQQVASITQTSGPTQVNHYGRQRVVSVGADLDTGVSLSQVQPAVRRVLSSLVLPPGYTVALGGSSQQQGTAFGQLFTALGASVMLAYLLMAVLYNSLTHPLVILFSLPAAVGGAMFGLLVFRYDFSVFSLIGLILLVGLAIKNGVLLVDRTNQNRARGLDVREALLEAGPARLRAILMTSMTIGIALLPTALKLGEGAEIRAPLAATVIGGVVSSTLLTLVLIPVVYTLVDAFPRAVRRRVAAVWRLAVPARAAAPAERVAGDRAASAPDATTADDDRGAAG